MKTIMLLVGVVLYTSLSAQVGLLSTNNKSQHHSIDTLSTRLSSVIASNFSESNNENIKNFEDVKSTVKSDLNAPFKASLQTLKTNSEDIKFIRKDLKSAKPSEKRKLLKKLEAKEKSNALIKRQIDSATNLIKAQDSFSTNLLRDNFNLIQQKFHNKLDSILAVTKSVKDASYKNYLLARDRKSYLDSSEKIKNSTVFSDGIATVQMRFIDLYENIKSHKTSIETNIEKLQSISFSNVIKDQSPKNAKDNIDSIFRIFANDSTKSSNNVKQDTTIFKDITRSYNELIKEQIITKETKEVEFGGLPQVTSVLGKREVITQLQLYGSYTYQSQSTSREGNIGLSVSPNAAPDTNNLYSLFIPTASKYLINSSFTFGFWTTNRSTSHDNDSAKRLGIKIDFALAGKNLVFDTVKTVRSINNTVLYTKTGLEFGILPKRFSIYGNVNTVTVLDKAAEFKSATNMDSKFFGFIDCGAKFYLDPTGHLKSDDGLFIYANINAIINGGDVKRITKTDDLVIPSIQIGLVKRLGKF